MAGHNVIDTSVCTETVNLLRTHLKLGETSNNKYLHEVQRLSTHSPFSTRRTLNQHIMLTLVVSER